MIALININLEIIFEYPEILKWDKAMNDDHINKKSFLEGVITGAILGGLAGLLFSPKSGKKLRRDISDKTEDILDDTNRLIKKAKEKASDIISDATKRAEKIIEDGRKKVESIAK